MDWQQYEREISTGVLKNLSVETLKAATSWLSETGAFVYNEHHPVLSRYVILDPNWVCNKVLGKLYGLRVAGSADLDCSKSIDGVSGIVGSDIPEDLLVSLLAECFHMCHHSAGDGKLSFPHLARSTSELTAEETGNFPFHMGWSAGFTQGCVLECVYAADMIPPGFWPAFQLELYKLGQGDPKAVLFRECIYFNVGRLTVQVESSSLPP